MYLFRGVHADGYAERPIELLNIAIEFRDLTKDLVDRPVGQPAVPVLVLLMQLETVARVADKSRWGEPNGAGGLVGKKAGASA